MQAGMARAAHSLAATPSGMSTRPAPRVSAANLGRDGAAERAPRRRQVCPPGRGERRLSAEPPGASPWCVPDLARYRSCPGGVTLVWSVRAYGDQDVGGLGGALSDTQTHSTDGDATDVSPLCRVPRFRCFLRFSETLDFFFHCEHKTACLVFPDHLIT